MDTIIETAKVVAWTLGVTSAVGAVVLTYLSFHLRRTSLLRPAVYLALVSVPLLSVAIGSLTDGIRPKVISVGVAFSDLGVLGLLTTTRYRLIMRLRPYSITALGIGLLIIIVALQTAPDSLDVRRPSGLTEQAIVTRSIDGDTIVVSLRGQEYRVRYIGMDTPETVHPSKPIECFGKEASDFNKSLVEGESVWLERDVSQTDIYGRLLRYVWLGDQMVNAILVREGYAQIATFPPDVRYQEKFLVLERLAREENKGLWNKCR